MSQRRPPISGPSGSSQRHTSSHASAPRRQASQRRSLRPGSHRQASSMALVQQKLAEMGSYAKYYKAITQNPFQVKIRCACGRSRNMAWMFLCTYCATGTKVEKEAKSDTSNALSKVASTKEEDTKKQAPKTEEKTQAHKTDTAQRAYLSCDLCAQKMTESYYCPHCLAAYPAHYVKLHTRCTRCVSCPVCTSPLEKIVYSGSSSSKSSDVSDSKSSRTKPKKDVYLYQCPFCFWSSNIVGLEASESEALLENLKEKLKRPVEEKTLIMNEIKNKYLQMNEELRKEEDRIEKSKRFHTYKGGRSLFSNGKKKNDSMDKKSKVKISLAAPQHQHGRQPSMQSVETLNALETMKKKLRKKFEVNHVLNTARERNIEPPLDQRYVSQFHLRNVSPLEHRLNDPLNQYVEMDRYVPQRFHLMTKESYKCPSEHCGKYVCKPTLRGRQANYDKRTAVLDYLPRINIEMKSVSGMITGNKTEIVIMVQNRHLYEASFKFDASINENDLYSTAKISCSSEWFVIDPADIHIKGGKQKDVTKANGDYVKGKEAGITFIVVPKHYSTGPRNVKFSVRCVFKTKLQLKDDKSTDKSSSSSGSGGGGSSASAKEKNKAPLLDTHLPYILDFELGEAKSPDSLQAGLPNIAEQPKPKAPEKERDNQNQNQNQPQHKSRKSNENIPTNI